jgi:hypothetical protein
VRGKGEGKKGRRRTRRRKRKWKIMKKKTKKRGLVKQVQQNTDNHRAYILDIFILLFFLFGVYLKWLIMKN